MTRMYAGYDRYALEELLAADKMSEDPDDPHTWELEGHAVTEALRAALPDLDEEELEHYAMTEAAQASLRMIQQNEGYDARRLVLAIETPTVEPRPGAPSSVAAEFALLHDVVAWLVDTDEAMEDVKWACLAVQNGEADADALAQRCLDHELAWYAAGELDDVMRLS